MPETAEQEQINARDFLGVVRRSMLVRPEALESALLSLDVDQAAPADVAASLIEKELLTRWQARRLLKRRWKDFFLGKYRLLDELGRGGMAVVYLARHETLRNLVAIKLLARSRAQKGSMSERFLREARAAAQISHPNIVRVFDVDVEEERRYLVMEFVQGCSLQDLVERQGPLSFRQAAEFTRQAAAGLARAHESGLVHRDIKPANLLVEEAGTVKITDFGLARVESSQEDGSLTMEHGETVLGTADYIAPEQAINSHRIDARADQYCLGYSLYFMLTGQPPFPSGAIVERLTKHCTVDPPGVATFRPDAPQGLLGILHRLTRKKPHQRYPSMTDVADALSRWLSEDGAGGRGRSRPQATIPASSQTARTSSPSSADDDLLTLAPEFDERPARDSERPQSRQDAVPARDNTTVDPVVELDAGSLEDADPLTDLLDELGDADPLADVTSTSDLAAAHALGLDGIGSSAALNSSAPGAADGPAALKSAARDTSTGHAMPTRAGNSRRAESKPLSEMYERMKRGEIPLWILIAAGIILGAILLLIAYSFLTSFEPIQAPDRVGEG